MAEFTATVPAERDLAGGFIVVVLYTPAVFRSASSLVSTQIIVRELPPLPTGAETQVQITSKMFTHVPNQQYFIQIFDDRGREILTNVARRGWSYYQAVERARLADLMPRYLERFVGQDRAAVPWVVIKPILPTAAPLPVDIVSASLTVSSEGNVEAVSLSVELDPAVTTAVREALGGWLFLPGLKAGVTTNSTVVLPLKF